MLLVSPREELAPFLEELVRSYGKCKQVPILTQEAGVERGGEMQVRPALNDNHLFLEAENPYCSIYAPET